LISIIVVEGSGSDTGNQLTGSWKRLGRDTVRKSGKSDNESGGEFSEHDDDLNVGYGRKVEFVLSTDVRPTLEEIE
jgi:hypothetical protein